MDEENKEKEITNDEGGVSIREVFRLIGKKIWYVLAGTVLVTLAAVLVFMLALNPAKQYQSMSFKIDYPMSDEGKYPDGSMFDYRDVASRGVIEAAKNDKRYQEQFASIDVDKIMKSGGVTISAEQISDKEKESYIYTVSLQNSCFKGVDAEDFIEALTDAFMTEVVDKKAAELDYKLDREVFKSTSYKGQLLILSEQKEVILRQYADWIGEYREGHQVQGKSLGTYRTEALTTLADTVKAPIENDLTTKGYEYFNENVTADAVKIRVQQLQEELKLDKAILEELKSYYTDVSTQSEISTAPFAATADESNDTSNSGGNDIIIMPGDSNLSQRMAYYSERYAIVKQQIKYLTSKSLPTPETTVDENTPVSDWDFTPMATEIKEFEDKLSAQFDILNGIADTLTAVIRAIYNRDTLVTFTSQHVTSEGGTNILIVGIAAFVVSFLVFAVIAYFVGRKSAKPKKSESAPEAENGKNE